MTGRRSPYAERQVLIIAFAAGALAALVSLVLLAHGAWAHTSEARFSPPSCIDGAAWSATLSITATNVELDPVATVSDAASPFDVHVGAAWRQLFTSRLDSMTVSVRLRWSDGFTKDLGSFTATRPDGCTPPPSSPPAPVPVAPDVSIAAPTSVVPPPAESTTTSSSATTVPPPSTPATTAPPAKRTPPAPSGVAVAQLPVTGSGTELLVRVVVALVLAGAFLLLVVRRRSRSSR